MKEQSTKDGHIRNDLAEKGLSGDEVQDWAAWRRFGGIIDST